MHTIHRQQTKVTKHFFTLETDGALLKLWSIEALSPTSYWWQHGSRTPFFSVDELSHSLRTQTSLSCTFSLFVNYCGFCIPYCMWAITVFPPSWLVLSAFQCLGNLEEWGTDCSISSQFLIQEICTSSPTYLNSLSNFITSSLTDDGNLHLSTNKRREGTFGHFKIFGWLLGFKLKFLTWLLASFFSSLFFSNTLSSPYMNPKRQMWLLLSNLSWETEKWTYTWMVLPFWGLACLGGGHAAGKSWRRTCSCPLPFL